MTAIRSLWQRGLLSRVGSGFGWNLIGAAFNQGSTFVVSVLLARLWGLRLFGEYAMIYTTLLASAAIAQMSMGYTATKYVAETRQSDPGRAGRVLGLTGGFAVAAALLAAVLLFAAAPWIATSALGNARLAAGIRVAAIALAFTVVNGFLSGALAGLEAFRRLAKSGVAAGICFVAACWLGALGGGLLGALWGLVGAGLAQSLLLILQLRREMARQGLKTNWSGAWAERALIRKFSLPAAVGGMISMTAFWFANAALARQPQGYEAMALFTAASNWRLAVLFLPAILNVVGMAILNSHKGLRDAVRYRQMFWMNLALTLSITLLGAATVLAAGRLPLQVFGKAYAGGYSILAVLMAAAIAEAAVVAVYQLIQSQARLWASLFAVVIPRDLTIVALAYVLCPRQGAVGLATAYAVGWCLALVSAIGLASRHGLHLDAVEEARVEVPRGFTRGAS